MTEQAFVIEDYFSEGTNRKEKEEATTMSKKSDSGVEAARIKPGDEELQKPGVVPEDQNESHGEQDGELQNKIAFKESHPPSPPTAKDAADFLPFRRSVVDTGTLLE